MTSSPPSTPKPSASGSPEDLVRRFAATIPLPIIPIGADVATIAARLRAEHWSLQPPDAFVIATAIDDRCDVLLTTDRGWPEARALGGDLTIEQV